MSGIFFWLTPAKKKGRIDDKNDNTNTVEAVLSTWKFIIASLYISIWLNFDIINSFNM